MTMIEQHQDNYQQQYEQYQYNNNACMHDNNNNNNNNYHPEPGVSYTKEDLDEIRAAYEDNIGTLTGAAACMIEEAMMHGISPSDVIMAIEDTGMAPRPTPYYLRAILRRWAETGVTVSRNRRTVKPNTASKWWR